MPVKAPPAHLLNPPQEHLRYVEVDVPITQLPAIAQLTDKARVRRAMIPHLVESVELNIELPVLEPWRYSRVVGRHNRHLIIQPR